MTAAVVIPWAMCGAAVTMFMLIGLRAGRGMDTASDRFLTGGRNFRTPVIVLSAFATGNTGFMFVGAVGAGYVHGIAGLWLVLAWFTGEWVFWNLFPQRIVARSHRLECVSIPHYIATGASERGSRAVRRVAGAVVALTMVPYLVAQNVAAGKAVSLVLGSTPQQGVLLGAGVCTAIALLYCLRGGLRSSMMVNAAQGAFILAVAALIASILLVDLGGPAAAVRQITAVKPDAFDPFAVHGGLLVAVFFLGAAVASFGAMLGLPTVLMRLSVAADDRELMRAKWWTLGANYGFWGAMTLLGLLLVAAVPDIADPEQSLFAYARGESPVLLGLVLCGVAALILSTVDGSILVGGSALSDDLLDAQAKSARLRERARHAGLVVFSVTCLALAVLLATSSVFEIILFGQGALAGGLGPVFMIVTLGWRTSARALIATIATGIVAAIAWAAAGMAQYASEALPGFASGLVMHWLVMHRLEREGRSNGAPIGPTSVSFPRGSEGR